MTDFNISALMDVDVSGLVSGTEEAADSFEDVDEAAEETSESLLDIDAAGAAAGGALAGVGTMAQGAMDDSQGLREELHRTAEATELTSDELTDLTTSLTDATLGQEDAVGALDALAEQGIETEAELGRLVSESDNLADAVGTSAETVASDLGPAMAAVGDDVRELESVQDAVTLAVEESTLEFDEFTRQMERSSDELEALGLDTEDTAALMSEFADETGLSGRELRREFDNAVEDADGSLEELFDTTDVTREGFEEFRAEVEENDDITDDYAASVDESTTFMDDMRSVVGDAKLQFADMLGPASAAAPAMQGVGGAAMFVSTVNMSALVPSLGAVGTALTTLTGPVGIVIAAAAALAAAWSTNFLGIQDKTEAVADYLTDEFLDDILGMADSAVEFVEGLHDDAVGTFEDLRAGAADAVAGLTDGVERRLDALRGWVAAVWDLHPLSDTFEAVAGVITGSDGVVPSLRQSVEDILGQLRDWIAAVWDLHPLSDTFERGRDAVVGVTTSLGDGVTDRLGQLRDWIGSSWGFFETLTAPVSDAAEAITSRIQDAVGFFSESLSSLISWVRSKFTIGQAIGEQLSGALEAAMDRVRGFIEGVADTLEVLPGVDDIMGRLPSMPSFGGIGGGGGGGGPDPISDAPADEFDEFDDYDDYDDDFDDDFEPPSGSGGGGGSGDGGGGSDGGGSDDGSDHDGVSTGAPAGIGSELLQSLSHAVVPDIREAADLAAEMRPEGFDPDDHPDGDSAWLDDEQRKAIAEAAGPAVGADVGFVTAVEGTHGHRDDVVEGLRTVAEGYAANRSGIGRGFGYPMSDDDVGPFLERFGGNLVDYGLKTAAEVESLAEQVGVTPGRIDDETGGRIPGLATGGWLGGDGVFVGHAGERVLPEAQVNDRGEASFDSDSVADGFDDSSAADALLRKLDRLIDLLEADPGRVRKKDVLAWFEREADRRR